jgi:hypothetical protein
MALASMIDQQRKSTELGGTTELVACWHINTDSVLQCSPAATEVAKSEEEAVGDRCVTH